jgi:hypothetical protein
MPALGNQGGSSWLTALRRSRMARVRQALGWRKQWLNAAQQQLTAFEEALTSSAEGVDSGYDTSGEYTDTIETAPVPAEGGTTPAAPMPRRDAFFRVFVAMKGEDSEFTVEGYPKVIEVNDRLEMLGQDRATQKEVAGYYDEWRQSARAPAATSPSSGSSSSPTAARRQTFFRIFEQMSGEKAEFTVDGYPKVLEVNDRLESIAEERTNHKEVVTYFDEWKESPSGTTSGGSSGSAVSARTQALFRVFDAMKGQKSEFNVDGAPKVGNVNDRLEVMDQKPSTRDEIDKAFERWQKQ